MSQEIRVIEKKEKLKLQLQEINQTGFFSSFKITQEKYFHQPINQDYREWLKENINPDQSTGKVMAIVRNVIKQWGLN